MKHSDIEKLALSFTNMEMVKKKKTQTNQQIFLKEEKARSTRSINIETIMIQNKVSLDSSDAWTVVTPCIFELNTANSMCYTEQFYFGISVGCLFIPISGLSVLSDFLLELSSLPYISCLHQKKEKKKEKKSPKHNKTHETPMDISSSRFYALLMSHSHYILIACTISVFSFNSIV